MQKLRKQPPDISFVMLLLTKNDQCQKTVKHVFTVFMSAYQKFAEDNQGEMQLY